MMVQAIHTSVRIESPTCCIQGKEVHVFPHTFKVLKDEAPPSGGVVLALLHSSKSSQMLKAFWLQDQPHAEQFINVMPHPTSVFRRQHSCKAQVMPEKDWRFYREEWLSMNRDDGLDPCG